MTDLNNLLHKNVVVGADKKEGLITGFHQFKDDEKLRVAVDLKGDNQAPVWFALEDLEVVE